MKSKASKGVLLNTQGFCYQDVCFLCALCRQKFDLKVWPRSQKQHTQYQIYVSGESAQLLYDLLTPYFTEDMWYKFPCPRQRRKKVTHCLKSNGSARR
jgi:hypothetical protein